jgi:hypothetical protein
MISSLDKSLISAVAGLADDPWGFVIFAFPWKEKGNVLEKRWPEPWQEKFLKRLGEEIKKRGFDGAKSVQPIRMAVRSGHGIGKSALVAWLIMFLLATRPHAMGTITANTMRQLDTKTWGELRKWGALALMSHWFQVKSKSIRAIESPGTWKAEQQSSKEENHVAFAGQHAIDSSSFYIFDEASATPRLIWETADGGMTDGEPFHFAFGNPTQNTGNFANCFTKDRGRWITFRVDSREVSFTNKEEIAEWEKKYGEDSDFMRVRVKGIPPRVSSTQFISIDTYRQAISRSYPPSVYDIAPKVLGVDVAWEGDDHHVIFLRQGLVSRILGSWQHLPHETATLTNLIVQFEDEYEIDATFVDQHGVGAGVIDQLRQLNREPIAVNSQARPTKPEQFDMKRSEMAWDLREWLYAGGQLPEHGTLEEELTGIEHTVFPKMSLESAKAFKKRLGISPDHMSALMYTFATQARKKSPAERLSIRTKRRKYDPLRHF